MGKEASRFSAWVALFVVALLVPPGLLARTPARLRTLGPIGYWKLDDLASPAVDAISGTNGTWVGTITPSKDVPAPLSGANAVKSCGSYQISIVGAPNYVQIPTTNAALNTVQDGSYSIACWFKPTSTPPNTGANQQYAVVMKAGWNEGISYNTNGQFAIYHWYGGDPANFATNPPTNIAAGFGAAYAINTWYHLVGVVDTTVSPNQVRMYVNGAQDGGTGSYGPTATYNWYDAESWQIGIGIPNSAGAQFQADGLFDDVRIYDRALTTTEISTLAAGGTVGDPAVAPPAAPVLQTPPTLNGTQVQLTWGAVTGATSYNIKRSTSTGTETQYAASNTATYTDTGTTGGTTYFYEVTAVASCAESAVSNEATIMVPVPPPPVPSGPKRSKTCSCGSMDGSEHPWPWIGGAGTGLLLLALLGRRPRRASGPG